MSGDLLLVGYWCSERHPELPDPEALVDGDWDEVERQHVVDYLRSGFGARHFLGFSPCRLCDHRFNGASELTDGVFIWPEGLVHYVEDHSVRLPRRFVEHVYERMAAFEAASVDDSWWRSIAGQ